MSALVQWLEAHLAPCFYKKYLGVDCPGCGMQRSFIALLKGEFAESLSLYPALLPSLFMLALLLLHLIFKFRNGGTWLKYNFILVAAIVVISYAVKISEHL